MVEAVSEVERVKKERAMLFGRDRICAVVAAPTAREMAQQLRRALKLTRTIELRFDWLKSQMEITRFTTWLATKRWRATLIATCRTRQAGGRFRGSVLEQWINQSIASVSGCNWCDMEGESVWACPPEYRDLLLRKARRMISWHCFAGTPQRLEESRDKLAQAGWDAVKIATDCASIADSLRVLKLARGRKDIVAVPMGEAGLPARILALREGSALAYAAVGEATAPGQLSLDEMKNLYRADKLDRRTRVYGVIGDPVHHSLSPLMQNVGFRARRMNAVYLPFRVRDLRDFLAAIRPLGIAGFSVTLPHKESVLKFLDGCDPLARSIGAVNTVVVRAGGKLHGYNTDYVGVLRALERRVPLWGSRVLVYGAGGAARAVAFALAQGGAVVCVCARRLESARRLARATRGEVIARSRVRQEFFDAIINATPVGMYPRADLCPFEPRELNCRLVMDLVYRPMQTKLLRMAESRGIETISGVEMFLAQGTAQWEIWTGVRAPEAAMRRAVLAKLRGEVNPQRRQTPNSR